MARSPVTMYFGSELRRAREAAGLSREEFGRLVNYAASTIGAFETGDRYPTPAVAVGADLHLNTDGRFGRMLDTLLVGSAHPEWFRPWSDIERCASEIRTFEPIVVAGLLQTEAYARALTGDDEATAARLGRQQILTGDHPPEVVTILDESVLHRRVAGAEVMHRQLRQLADPPGAVRVQVLPRRADTYLGLDGSFALATVEGRDYVYVHTPARGFVLDRPEIVSEIRRRWDVLRGEALPVRQSRDLILEAAKAWTNES